MTSSSACGEITDTWLVDNEIKQKKQYKLFSRLINSCLGLQIVVAAALTALGAANGSRSAVTVFGAVITVIAGFLTYLKGSGLPGRLQYFQHEWWVDHSKSLPCLRYLFAGDFTNHANSLGPK